VPAGSWCSSTGSALVVDLLAALLEKAAQRTGECRDDRDGVDENVKDSPSGGDRILDLRRHGQQLVAAGVSAYLNRFSGEPYGATVGACHAADLAEVFGRLAGTPADTPENRAIADQLIQAWADFIRDGDPGRAVYDAQTAGNTRQSGGSADTITETPDDRTWTLP